MTDTPPPADDGADEAVPEPAAPAATARPVGRTVRIGCIVLIAIGALGLFVGFSLVSDPDGARCAQARAILEDEEEVEDGGEVECDAAIPQAAELAEADDDVAEVLSESAVRTQGWILGAIAALQIVGAVVTLRTRSKAARLAALIGAGLGIVFSPLGLLAILPLGFAVYAILFSGDARAVFGDPGGPRMFRPRTG
jgi:hypothetical protein